MEPIAIENRPNFYKRPTLIAREPRDSIAAKDYSIVDEGSGPNGGGSSGTNGGIYLQYKFEENGNEETLKYNLTPYGSPNFSNYVELDGDDYLSVGIDFEVKTLSYWFNLTDVNTDNYLLSFDSDFYIKVNSNSLYFQTDNGNNCNISTDFFNNIWYNLALTSNNENYDIYLNNTKLLETIIYKDLSSSTLNIGAYVTDELQIDHSGITSSNTSIFIEAHSMVEIGSNIYIFGGNVRSSSTSDDAEVSNKLYKIDTNSSLVLEQIELYNNIPTSRKRHCMVVIDDNIYIFSGSNTETVFIDLYKIETTTFNSTKINIIGNIPSATAYSMVVIDSNMYIYSRSNLYKINKEGNSTQITLKGNKPPDRLRQSMVAIERNMYIFGGDDGFSYYNELYKIDTDGNSVKITIKGDVPPQRSYHSMVVIGNYMYIFGGKNKYISGSTTLYLNDLYKIDTEGNSVKINLINDTNDKPTARVLHSMVAIGNDIYIFGGKTTNYYDDLVKIPFTPDIKYLNGKIADLRLYDTIKTEDEINTIYNQYN